MYRPPCPISRLIGKPLRPWLTPQLFPQKGALLAGCLGSTGSWPVILDNDNSRPWAVRAIWHGGLVFALFGVLIAAQQSIRLHRLCAHRDGLQLLRGGLAMERGPDGYRPHLKQVWAWETSVVFLAASVVCLITGLTALMWVSAGYGPGRPDDVDWWWGENSKVRSCNCALSMNRLSRYFLFSSRDTTWLTKSRHRWPLYSPSFLVFQRYYSQAPRRLW